MASQGWPPRLSRLRNVACAIGLAAGWLLVLLLCAGQSTPALSASGGSGADAVQRRAWAETGDVSATWTSTQPVTTEVDSDPLVWPITQHGVTVTFYRNAVRGSAWFTFTPRSPSELPSGYLATPYFFDLDGVYKDTGWPVSLDDTGIQIELKYDPSRLGEIENPRTLQFFHFGKTEWLPQGGDVDLAAKTLTLKTERTQSFGVGGDPPKQYVYLALVMRK